MTALLLVPHNDDETLFASYVCQRERPHVIVVLRSFVQLNGREISVGYRQREEETDCAMQTLGCTWEQWHQRDDDPDWETIRAALQELDGLYDDVYAPLPEPEGGHDHHDRLGALAASLWPHTRFYTTYSYGRHRSTAGTPIEHTWEQEQRRAKALGCYWSQQQLWSTAHHFTSALENPVEYLVTPVTP